VRGNFRRGKRSGGTRSFNGERTSERKRTKDRTDQIKRHYQEGLTGRKRGGEKTEDCLRRRISSSLERGRQSFGKPSKANFSKNKRERKGGWGKVMYGKNGLRETTSN